MKNVDLFYIQRIGDQLIINDGWSTGIMNK